MIVGESKADFKKIGLFDSGVGGLSVLRQLALIPKPLKFVYFGDTARCPYGNRKPAEIMLFAEQILDWLISQDIECVIMACNTSAAIAGEMIRRVSSIPVYDLISPTASYIANFRGKVAVLATASTVSSHAFSKATLSKNPNQKVLEIACPELVPLIEKGLLNNPETHSVLEKYVRQLIAEKVDAVVFGCTHYPFLHNLLKGMLPNSIELIDPAYYLACEFEKALPDQGLLTKHEANNLAQRTKFFVTGSPIDFAQTATLCLGQDLGSVYGLSVEEISDRQKAIYASEVIAETVSQAVSSIYT